MIWLAPGRHLAPGEIHVEAGRVVALSTCRARQAPPQMILPGLVNAHVHLQLPALGTPRRSFVPWVRAVVREQAAATSDDNWRRGMAVLRQLVDDGVTAVGEVDATGTSPAILRALPVAGRCYQEVLGFDLDTKAARRLLARRLISGSRWCPLGLSPHAPYSVSPALFREVIRAKRPLTVHVAETREEVEFLRHGKGPFRDLLSELGKLPPAYRPPGKGPVEYLHELGLLSPRSLLVHAQHVSPAEVELIEKQRAPVVVCPGTIRYFRRRPPPVATWLSRGICVALGTDSLASNQACSPPLPPALSLRAELTVARDLWPALPPEALLSMVTVNGGRALSRPGCGRLAPGGPANFITVPCQSGYRVQDMLEGLVSGEVAPAATWLRGRRARRSVEAALGSS